MSSPSPSCWDRRTGTGLSTTSQPIERAMAVRLGADLSYNGFTCKNPLHPYWETLSNDHLYTTVRVGRVARRSQRLPAAGTACDRLGAKRRDVRGREPMAYRGIREHKAAGGTLDTWRQGCIDNAEAFTVARHVPALDRSECRSIGRSVGRWTLGTSHGRMVLNETGGPWPCQRSEPPGGRGGAQPAYSDACGFRDDLGGNPGRDRREPRHCRSCAPGGPRAGKGGVSRTRSGCKRLGGIRGFGVDIGFGKPGHA